MIYEQFVSEHREEPIVYMSEAGKDILPGAGYGPVIRDIYMVECCTSGYGAVIINGNEFPIEPGCCFFLMPGDTVIYTADTETPHREVWCAFDSLQTGRVMSRAGITSENPFAPRDAFNGIKAQIEQIIKMKNESDPGADLRRAAHIYGIFGELLRFTSAAADKNTWIERAVGIMETKYHRPVKIKEIADAVGLDRSYFSILFREQTGISPHAYLNTLRVKKACALMKQSDITIADTAEEVGLDYRNFARLFKKITGKTPREYKKLLNTSKKTDE